MTSSKARGDLMPKVLVVDDDNRMVLLLTMTMPGNYVVMQAKDGEEALRMAEEQVPDVILLDVNMPRLNGFEVLRKVRQSGKLKKTRVIMVTARSDEADRNLGMQLGANAYLSKPFSPLALLDLISKLLSEA
ncbi:MAG: response regulator [Chloroflexi bacterium]|nr:response regulator [Chloroflexota bacterium]